MLYSENPFYNYDDSEIATFLGTSKQGIPSRTKKNMDELGVPGYPYDSETTKTQQASKR